MKIAIGTDHIKKEIIRLLESKKIEVLDLSPRNFTIDDYTDYAIKVGEAVRKKEATYGILICGTGIGMSIAANKVKGIRCAHVSNINEAALSREHNDAQIIAMSAKKPMHEIIKMIDIFINTNFKEEERHIRRINKITEYEEKNKNV